jgi:hypothetical protein
MRHYNNLLFSSNHNSSIRIRMPSTSGYGCCDFFLYFSSTSVPHLIEPDVPPDLIEILKYHSDHLLYIYVGDPGIAPGLLFIPYPFGLLILNPLYIYISRIDCLPFLGGYPTCAARRRSFCISPAQSLPCALYR